jgi:hypothetical protein
MTALYSGEIPLDQVVEAFSKQSKTGNRILENMENGAAAQVIDINGAAYENRTHT